MAKNSLVAQVTFNIIAIFKLLIIVRMQVSYLSCLSTVYHHAFLPHSLQQNLGTVFSFLSFLEYLKQF